MAREIWRAAGWWLALHRGGLAQTVQQAHQARAVACQPRFELHGGAASWAAKLDVEASLEQLGPRAPSRSAVQRRCWSRGLFPGVFWSFPNAASTAPSMRAS